MGSGCGPGTSRVAAFPIDPGPRRGLPDLPYNSVKLVFTDLDGTLFPGVTHEEEPKDQRRGLMENMNQARILEEAGVPVIPATGNTVGMAQMKMLHPQTKGKLRDLRTSPGIYCNGAHVIGMGGKEIQALSLEHFVPILVDRWLSAPPPKHSQNCLIGLGKTHTLCMKHPGQELAGKTAGDHFNLTMMIPESEYMWLEPEAFKAESNNILSLIIMFPVGMPTSDLLAMQSWLDAQQLLSFDDPAGRLSNGVSSKTVCKHVHVPGMGPEIDISPVGINKGSAIMKLLADTDSTLGIATVKNEEIAVFGDAANDVELFGMKRNSAGTELVPLEFDYRPGIRVAMPWADDKLLVADANVHSTCNVVFQQIAKGR